MKKILAIALASLLSIGGALALCSFTSPSDGEDYNHISVTITNNGKAYADITGNFCVNAYNALPADMRADILSGWEAFAKTMQTKGTYCCVKYDFSNGMTFMYGDFIVKVSGLDARDVAGILKKNIK